MPEHIYTLALTRTALATADEAVISEVETEGTSIGPARDRRWDISAMFNANEHCPEFRDRALRDICYAAERGLLALESESPCVVRILKGLHS